MKSLDTLSIKKVVNLSRLCGFLIANEDVPLHFFKVIDFNAAKLSKPTELFLHLMLQAVVDMAPDGDKLRIIFVKGLKDESNKHESFVKGIAKFILGKFYKRKEIDITVKDYEPVIHCAPNAALSLLKKVYCILTDKE